MEKLKQMTTAELAEQYYDKFGYPAETDQKDRILAAIWWGKRIPQLTMEEVETANEQ